MGILFQYNTKASAITAMQAQRQLNDDVFVASCFWMWFCCFDNSAFSCVSSLSLDSLLLPLCSTPFSMIVCLMPLIAPLTLPKVGKRTSAIGGVSVAVSGAKNVISVIVTLPVSVRVVSIARCSLSMRADDAATLSTLLLSLWLSMFRVARHDTRAISKIRYERNFPIITTF